MRHQRFFLGDLLLAERAGESLSEHGFAFFCPACGNIWGRVDSPNTNLWSAVQHYCRLHPERLLAYSGPAGSEFRVPGSFLHAPINFALAGLLLTSPLLASHEFASHHGLDAHFLKEQL